MLTFFIHFGLSFRQADHWLASRLFCPFTPPPPPSPHHSSCHFFNGPFLINNSLVLADVLKSILGISRTDLWSQASFFIKPTQGAGWGGGLIYFKPI